MFSRDKNPYIPSLVDILRFIQFRSKDLSPSTLLQVRHRLKWIVSPSYHHLLNSIQVSRFLAGLFNLNPPPPKPPREIWDVNQVLDFLNQLPPNKDLPIILLSQKLTILILISTMRRKNDLLGLHLDYMLYRPNEVIFTTYYLPKSWNYRKQVSQLRYVSVKAFPQNRQICPLAALQEYIKRTRYIRKSRFLLITTQGTYDHISPTTLRRWIVQILQRSGINMSQFTSYSTRHASSSKAYFAGVNIDLIVKRAGWATVSCFIAHYNLPIRIHEINTQDKPETTSGKYGQKRTVCYTPDLPTGKSSTISRARQILSAAKKVSRRSAVDFVSSPFADPPVPIPRIHMPHKVRVTLPARKSSALYGTVKKVTLFTDSVPVSHISKAVLMTGRRQILLKIINKYMKDNFIIFIFCFG